ncbi:MAG: TlpA disulfide reductase family protein [Rhodoferax sp.]|nr:TlpA disulfide reductase family protein [Rhodoferax sp.]
MTASWMRNMPPEAPAVTAAVPDFWDLKWRTPSGGALSMQSLQGRPLLINFWATWCPPCVEELPLINAFFQQNQANGWQVLGLAVDKPALVLSFLARNPLAFPVAMAGFGGTELSKALGNLSGGLPFSVTLNAKGGIIQRKMGQLDANDLALLRGLK